MKKHSSFTIQVKAPFNSYKSKALDDKAKKYIQNYIKEILKLHACNSPIIISKDEDGCWVDEASGKINFKFGKLK